MSEAPNGICGLCRLPLGESNWNWDHIVPRKMGGTNLPENKQRVHIECNQLKGSYDRIVYCVRCHKRLHVSKVNMHWESPPRPDTQHRPGIPLRPKFAASVAVGKKDHGKLPEKVKPTWRGIRRISPGPRVPLTGPWR